MALVGPRPPVVVDAAHLAQHRHELFDGVDRAAGAPVGLRLLRVPRPAGDGETRLEDAAAGHPGLEAGRLGAEAGLRSQPALGEALHDRPAPHARRLLVGDRGEDDLAGQRHAGVAERLEGDDQGRKAALHVVGAASEQQAVALGEHERVAVPLLARLHVDGVDVAGKQQAARRARGGVVEGRCGGRLVEPGARAAAGVARQTGDQLRPPHEVEVRRHEPPAGTGRRRLPQVDLAAQGGEARRQQALKLRFSARRRTGVAGRRVQSDEGARERHEIVAPRPHRGHDPIFQGGTFGGHVLAASFTC